ncbi:MAG: hypothetical protein PF505_00395, partial [Vallitaleaceae bacterium]|nr:hypothetical protein [Vallitaleaceae bacterium]
MKRPRIGITKSLRRKLTNQYLGIFTVVYIVLIVAILITTAIYNYTGIKTHTTDSILKRIHNGEEIKKYEAEYQDGYEQYIRSYATYQTVEFKKKMIDGVGEMPDYDRLF